MTENTLEEEPVGAASRLLRGIGRGLRRLFEVRAKTWGYLLLAVVVIVFVVQNWAPAVRVEFLLFTQPVPLAVVAIFFVLVGFGLCYLYRRRLKV